MVEVARSFKVGQQGLHSLWWTKPSGGYLLEASWQTGLGYCQPSLSSKWEERVAITTASGMILTTSSSSYGINESGASEHLTESVCSSFLSSCADHRTLRELHAVILCSGCRSVSVCERLVALYANFCDVETALGIFWEVSKNLQPSTRLWNLTMKIQIDAGFFESALSLYSQMRAMDGLSDVYTFPLLNRAIASLPYRLNDGRSVHCLSIKAGFGWNLYFCNTLIEMYGKNGLIHTARQVFDEMLERDLVSWTSMISNYVRVGKIDDSLKLFSTMRGAGFEPSEVTFVTMFTACSAAKYVLQGLQFHAYTFKKGFVTYDRIQNSILLMYMKHCRVNDAEKFFRRLQQRDVVAWNIMIRGFTLTGNLFEVIKSFNEMRMEVHPNLETLTLVISAFTKSADILHGQSLHGYALKSGLIDTILQTSLMAFYANGGEVERSVLLFQGLAEKNCVSFSVMMLGFVHNGYFKEAMELFRHMQLTRMTLGPDILRSLVLVCTHLGAFRLGKEIHGWYIRKNFYWEKDESTQTSIVIMYAKCGSIYYSRRCFDQIVFKDVVAWSSMIEGYGIHGLGLEALEIFHKMTDEGVKPNSVTFVSLLSACSHTGLVKEGREVFHYMKEKCCIEPNLYHYTSLVDLLARSGKLQEAMTVIKDMTLAPDSRIWGSLLASCRVYSDCELGEYVAQRVFDLEPENAGYHVVLCNTQASIDKWGEAETVQKVMRVKNLKKKPAWSSLEARGEFHTFIARDTLHPQIKEIYETLRSLANNVEQTAC
ncbi:pentatricopeptide repeat-containing protein DOT4, chloroplastic-like [Aristolochia californica]|uniref:pentatricopeptide repeat-containing protein DOT4, chloroplastic-like n=1 Tax=Aristolochia californica TaxID=171875 RepID=UPI0035DA6546